MKKFIILVCVAVVLLFAGWYAYYQLGFYVDVSTGGPVESFMKVEGKEILMERDGQWQPFEIRGVNMGVGIPGEWATDYAIDEETYLRWFQYVQELGANTIRVYILLQDDFYNALYEYNTAREAAGEEPLWLIHGVWVNDYVQFSHRDAYDPDFRESFIDDCQTLVDVLHGQRSLSLGRGLGSGSYRNDVSRWVIGYILGVEWEDVTVAYTNNKYPERNSYQGTYMYTSPEATAFEAMLCEVGDKIIEYESSRYGQQRLVAFSNWPTTDPFVYPADITAHFLKCATVDVEHIRTTDAFIAGQFASYHVYPYYPDYFNYLISPVDAGTEEAGMGDFYYETDYGVRIGDLLTGDLRMDFYDYDGNVNTYYAYLKILNEYHTLPVVISEYGVSTGRGMAQRDTNTGRNQGHMTEQEQGQAIIDCYEDIMAAGCAGSCIFTWQDEWFKRTWNTMHAVDLDNTPYWSDYQTNEQYFGLLAFDPGEDESVCYVDGDSSEWGEEDVVIADGEAGLSMKYDEKFIYFYLDGVDARSETLYIPIDTTPKTGSTYCQNYGLNFSRRCDFVICIDGEDNSRVLVQERYEVIRAMFLNNTEMMDPYVNAVEPDTPVFKPIELILQFLPDGAAREADQAFESYETGNLRYGNADPEAEGFDSLADFCFTDDGGVEIRIPWQLLNFANPSEMMIHDDYYEHYGIEYIHIDEMYVGFSRGDGDGWRIPMAAFPLEGWGTDVTYHERLKRSYYILQEYWAGLDGGPPGRRSGVGAEVLLYGYGIVCLSMLVFNVIYSLHLRADDRRTQKRVEVIQRQAEGQLEGLRADVHQPLQASHLAWMRRRLARISYLLAFDRFLDEQDTEEPAVREYLRQLQPVFLYLSTVYWKREDTQAAYYCHFLARHRLQRHMELDQVQRVVLSYLKKDSLYCRLNALKALCSFGSPEVLGDALEELSRDGGSQLHEKMVTEALLSYTGSAKALIELLWRRFERFSAQIQRAVLDYIRFQSGDYKPQMEEILLDGGRDKELRLAAIRYFGRYPDEGVRGVLLGFVRSGDALQWEYAAIAATALARYPGQDVVNALMGAMHSSNWYVRYNASASLEAHGLSYEGMMDILAGDDRYAREMLNYRLESRRLQRSAAAPREKEAVGV